MAALAWQVGVDPARIAEALKASAPEAGRQEILQGKGDITIINDAYNANPDSMRASLAMFSALNVKHKRYAVLGDMGELGSFAEACHEAVGTFAATQKLDYLICVGELARSIARGALEAGFPADHLGRRSTNWIPISNQEMPCWSKRLTPWSWNVSSGGY